MCSQKLSALPCGNTFEKSCRRWLRDSFPFGHSDLKINFSIIPTILFKNTWMTETRKALFSHQNEFFSDRTQGPSFSGFFLWPARFWTLVLVLVEVPPLAMVQARAHPPARLLESDFEKISIFAVKNYVLMCIFLLSINWIWLFMVNRFLIYKFISHII